MIRAYRPTERYGVPGVGHVVVLTNAVLLCICDYLSKMNAIYAIAYSSDTDRPVFCVGGSAVASQSLVTITAGQRDLTTTYHRHWSCSGRR